MEWTAPTLISERLALTPLTVDDADEMVSVLADEDMYAFTGGEPPTLEQLRSRYRQQVVGRSPAGDEWWLNWIVRHEPDGAVGTVQATVNADGSSVDVAWQVGVPWQGQGIASEAATTLVQWLIDNGVDRVTACINPTHGASAQVAARAGLRATEELVDGEVVWRRSAGHTNGEVRP